MKFTRLFLGLVFLLGSASTGLADSVIVLVRHAEKVDDGRDPELSESGRARARRLGEMLADSGVESIFSTDFIRTRETAKPLAERLSIRIELYDAADLGAFASKLKASPHRALVVGHSNTTAELVELLGGAPGSPIDDDEYDRLYVVSIASDGEVSSVLLRFAP